MRHWRRTRECHCHVGSTNTHHGKCSKEPCNLRDHVPAVEASEFHGTSIQEHRRRQLERRAKTGQQLIQIESGRMCHPRQVSCRGCQGKRQGGTWQHPSQLLHIKTASRSQVIRELQRIEWPVPHQANSLKDACISLGDWVACCAPSGRCQISRGPRRARQDIARNDRHPQVRYRDS